jgi:glucan phosphoethanolaminetransferase (alkaline phosphatase superfamily)
MPKPGRLFGRSLVFGAMLWFSLPSLFLAVYTLKFRAPISAIIPHLSLVASTLITLGMMRFMAYRFCSARLAIRGGAILASVFFLVLILYYTITLIGFETLGRVISWSLIETYAMQSSELLHALDINVEIVFLSFAIVFGLVCIGFYKFYERYDVIPILMLWGSRGMAPVLILLLSCLVFSQYWQLLDSESRVTAEPVSLMIFPNKGKQRFQSHYINALKSNTEGATPPAGSQGKPNVVLIVVDALRADHLAFNGYPRSTAPYLEALHREGKMQSFPYIYSVCTESSCGLMALASSRYVHQLDKPSITLHEVLRHNGYRINMILGGDHTNFFGLRDAYGAVDEYYDGSMTGGRYYMNDDQLVIDKLASIPDAEGQPNYFQFHLMSTHGLGSRDPALSKFFPARNYYRDVALRSVAHVEAYINFYDNGLLRTDAVIRQLLEQLAKKKYLDNALVVITADHGEMIGEQNLFSHAKAPFEPALRVPLMIARFGKKEEGEKIKLPEPASQIDIAPSILFELGLDQPAQWSGMPLQKIDEKRKILYFQQGAYYGLIDLSEPKTRWKYWVDGVLNTDRAYDLLSDPGEQNNRVNEIPAVVKHTWKKHLIESQMMALEYIQSFK